MPTPACFRPAFRLSPAGWFFIEFFYAFPLVEAGFFKPFS